jgi:hypothetical protein
MRERFRVAVTAMMDSLKLDALVYPTWSNPPRLIGDLNTPAGDNSQLFSPTTGFPAISVPMGYTRNNTLPAGMTFFGRAWSEGELITLAYGYEQATKHRRAPASTKVRSTVQRFAATRCSGGSITPAPRLLATRPDNIFIVKASWWIGGLHL